MTAPALANRLTRETWIDFEGISRGQSNQDFSTMREKKTRSADYGNGHRHSVRSMATGYAVSYISESS